MRIKSHLLLGLVFLLALGCDKKEEEPAITIGDLAGSWISTSSVYTNNSNAGEVIDLIAIGGELRFTMLEDGRVRTWFTLDTISDEWDSQAVLTDINTLTLTPVEAKRGIARFELALDKNTLELTNNNTSFDFTLSGAAEVPASSVTIYERN